MVGTQNNGLYNTVTESNWVASLKANAVQFCSTPSKKAGFPPYVYVSNRKILQAPMSTHIFYLPNSLQLCTNNLRILVGAERLGALNWHAVCAIHNELRQNTQGA